jgi:hypothetical protein
VSGPLAGPSSATMGQMTVVAPRPILRVEHSAPPPDRPVALAALIGVGWVVLAGLTTALAISVTAWFAADGGSFGLSIRIGALAWLVAHGSGVHADGVDVTAVPVGGVLLAGLLLYRAGRWAGATSAVDSLRDVGVGVLVMAGTYGASGTVVAALAHRSSGYVDIWRAAAVLASCAVVFGGLGLLRGSDLTEDLLGIFPDQVRTVAAGASAGFLSMVVASAVAFAVAMGAHLSSAMTIADGLDSGVVGGTILTLIGLSLVPNAVLCAGAFMAGPGFVLGTGTIVSSAGVHLGPLPAFPILAATPRSGGAWWQEALVAAPLLSGAVAGIVVLRRPHTPSYLLIAVRAAAAGAAGGLAFGAACLLATGAVGPGRMAEVGPDVLGITLVCGVAGLLSAPLVAVASAWGSEVADVMRRGLASRRSAAKRSKSGKAG